MILGLIPARANSKGIERKNLAPLWGRPLLFWTIRAAKMAKLDKIVLSSDGEEILAYAKSQGIEPLQRPAALAQDNTPSSEVILHALQYYKQCHLLVFLQPTSPFRNHVHINEAIGQFHAKEANALISVKAIDNKILKAFVCDEYEHLHALQSSSPKQSLKAQDLREFAFSPRQSLPKTYLSNGAIYILKPSLFLQTPTFLPPKTIAYEMDEQASFDIDTPMDLARANAIGLEDSCLFDSREGNEDSRCDDK